MQADFRLVCPTSPTRLITLRALPDPEGPTLKQLVLTPAGRPGRAAMDTLPDELITHEVLARLQAAADLAAGGFSLQLHAGRFVRAPAPPCVLQTAYRYDQDALMAPRRQPCQPPPLAPPACAGA